MSKEKPDEKEPYAFEICTTIKTVVKSDDAFWLDKELEIFLDRPFFSESSAYTIVKDEKYKELTKEEYLKKIPDNMQEFYDD